MNILRFTDLCEYCEHEIILKKRIAQNIKDHNYDHAEILDLTKMKKDLHVIARNIGNELTDQNISTEIRENLKIQLTSFKSMLETLRDYEVCISKLAFWLLLFSIKSGVDVS